MSVEEAKAEIGGWEGQGEEDFQTYLLAGTVILMRVVAAPKLQHCPSWIPLQHTAPAKQSLPVGRQMSAAWTAPKVAESAARITESFMVNVEKRAEVCS